MKQKTAQIVCTIIAIICWTECFLGLSSTWWITAVAFAGGIIFSVFAFGLSKRGQRIITEPKEHTEPIEYVNHQFSGWNECYEIALRQELKNAQMQR